MNFKNKLLSLLLVGVVVFSSFLYLPVSSENETNRTLEDDIEQTEKVNIENADIPDGTRTIYHYFLAASSDGDLLTYTSLHSSPNETRYSSGSGNNHKNQKWEISYTTSGSYYTLYPLGGENPYALTVNPSTSAVTVEPLDSTDVCQRWGVFAGIGTVYFYSLATGTSASGKKLVVNGSTATVSSSSYTWFCTINYDSYVESTSLSRDTVYVAPGSTVYVTVQNQAGNGIPTAITTITCPSSIVSISQTNVTGLTCGTSTLYFTDKMTGAQGSCAVNVMAIPNGTYLLKNKQNGCYARVKNGTMANGTNAVQYSLDSTNYEKWQSSTGYYTIKSLGSSTSYYLTVKNSASTLNQEIVLGTNASADGAKWRVFRTSSGACKLVPKTGENAGGTNVDYVLAVSTTASTNNNNLIQGKYVHNTSYKDEWFLRQELYHATVNSYYDNGYSVYYSESSSTSQNNINEYITNIAVRYLDLFGLAISFNSATYYLSPIDNCKGTVTSANIDTLCSHSGTCHTDRSNVISSFNNSFSGNNTTTNILWSCHKIKSVASNGAINYNRSCSVGTSIILIKRSAGSERMLYTQGVVMHELNHQYGAPDHYHELDANGNCKFADICSKCLGPNARPASCIMNDSTLDINNSDIICSGCQADILSHLQGHHASTN